jgi:hypothetical protein
MSTVSILGELVRKAAVLVLIVLFVQPASADVTITQRLGANGQNPQSDWTRKIFIKGMKLKIESQRGKKVFVTVYDLEAGQEMVWESKAKVANVFDLAAESAKLEKRMKTVRTSIQPMGQSKQALGVSCEQFKYEIIVSPPQMYSPVNHETGTLCVARDTPGSKDFAEFAEAAKNKGYFLGSVGNGDIPDTALFSAAAELEGLAIERFGKSEFQLGVGAGASNIFPTDVFHIIVTSITMDPIADEEFSIPSGRKIHKDRSMFLSVPINYLSGPAPQGFLLRKSRNKRFPLPSHT